jgi:hypothetical protein
VEPRHQDFVIEPLGGWRLAWWSLLTAFRRPQFLVLKLWLKAVVRRRTSYWEDLLVVAWQKALTKNEGSLSGRRLVFDDASEIDAVTEVWHPRVDLGTKVAVFAHFEDSSTISAVDLASLRALRASGYSVLVGSTSVFPAPAALGDLAQGWLVRPNLGHDFLSWRHLIEEWDDELSEAEFLLFLNNSARIEEQNCLTDLERLAAPVACVTDSFQRAPHLNSYCYLVALKRLPLAGLREFFFRVRALPSVQDIIRLYEIGFSDFLRDRKALYRAVVPYADLEREVRKNRRQYPQCWKALQREHPTNAAYRFNSILRDKGVGILKKRAVS